MLTVRYITAPLRKHWSNATMKLATELAFGLARDHKIRSRLFAGEDFSGTPDVPEGVCFDDMSLNRFTRGSLLQKMWLCLQLARRKDPNVDLYHFSFVTTPPTARFAKVLSRLNNKPSVTNAFSVEHLSDAELSSAFRTDCVVYFSQHTRNRLRRAGVSGLVKISPGVDTRKFFPGRNAALRKSLEIGEHDVVGLFPAEATLARGVDIALDCLKSLAPHYPRLKFVFACKEFDRSPPQAFPLKRRTGQEGLNHAVRVLGTVRDMAALYRACDFIFYPARSLERKTQWPLAILEGAASGLPTFAADSSYLREFVEGHGLGRCFESGNADSLAAGISQWLDGADATRADGRRCARIVRRHFAMETMLSAYARLYRDLVEHGKAQEQY